MTRDLLYARIADIVRRSGVDDAEQIIRDLEKDLVVELRPGTPLRINGEFFQVYDPAIDVARSIRGARITVWVLRSGVCQSCGGTMRGGECERGCR